MIAAAVEIYRAVKTCYLLAVLCAIRRLAVWFWLGMLSVAMTLCAICLVRSMVPEHSRR